MDLNILSMKLLMTDNGMLKLLVRFHLAIV